MDARELQQRWIEDRDIRDLKIKNMKEQFQLMSVEQQQAFLDLHTQEEIRVLRWFVEKLISQNVEIQDKNYENKNNTV